MRGDVHRSEGGFAMAALLVAMAVMAVAMSTALPVWHTMAQREKETELIFRGQQYARAVMLYQRRFPGAVPPNLDVLLNEHLLRKKYKDPITNSDFQLVGAADTNALQGAPGAATPGAAAPGAPSAPGAPPAAGGAGTAARPFGAGTPPAQAPSQPSQSQPGTFGTPLQ